MSTGGEAVDVKEALNENTKTDITPDRNNAAETETMGKGNEEEQSLEVPSENKNVGDLFHDDGGRVVSDVNEVEEGDEGKGVDGKDADYAPDAVVEAGDEENARKGQVSVGNDAPVQLDTTAADSEAVGIEQNGVLDQLEGHVQLNAEDSKINEHAEAKTETANVDGKEYSTVKQEGGDVHSNVKMAQHDGGDERGSDFDKVEVAEMDFSPAEEMKKEPAKPVSASGHGDTPKASTSNNPSFFWDAPSADGYESGTEEEQAAFRREVENVYRENGMEFKAPKFYKEDLNLLKLWRQVVKLGGYEQVTSCKLWRQVGESFKPPKTCTTVSWTFRIFYEKALVEYEKHRLKNGELPFSDVSFTDAMRGENQAGGSQGLGSGRARRDAAARAMQGWHSERLLDNGQVCHPIVKEKNLSSMPKSDKQLKTNGLLKRKKPSTDDRAVHITPMKAMKPQVDTMVYDIGPPAEWVKINVHKTIDCFEVYALVPGLLREEVHVQSDPAGRLIISGQPEQVDNPWGITAFKKVVSLPSRIDPHQTSAVVTLHGQLFVRVPFEQSDK